MKDAYINRGLLEDLEKLHFYMQDPSKWANSGICYSLGMVRHPGIHLMELFKTWDKFSGDAYFPVPSTIEGMSPTKQFMNSHGDTMWNREKSEYAKLRWELLEHCINVLKSELEKSK